MKINFAIWNLFDIFNSFENKVHSKETAFPYSIGNAIEKGITYAFI